MAVQTNIQDTIKLEFQTNRLKKTACSRQYLEYTQTINIFIQNFIWYLIDGIYRLAGDGRAVELETAPLRRLSMF